MRSAEPRATPWWRRRTLSSRNTRDGKAMLTASSNFFLLRDLENPDRTGQLADGDLYALRAVADWIKAFVALPNAGLGRTGPVCPFVPEAIARETLWLVPEHLSGRSGPDVLGLIDRYRKLLLQIHSTPDDAS